MRKDKHFKLIKEGDIVVLTDGRVFRSRNSNESDDHLVVTWLEGDEDNYIFDMKSLHIESIVNPTPEAIFTFNVANSLHKRLNRLSNV